MKKMLSALLFSLLSSNANATTIEIDRTIPTVWERYSFQPVTHRDWLYIHPTWGCSVTFEHISIRLVNKGWLTLYRGRMTISRPTQFLFPNDVQGALRNGDQYDALEYKSTTQCSRTVHAAETIYKAAPRDTEDFMARVVATAKVPVCSANVADRVEFQLEAGSTSPAQRAVTDVVGEEDCTIGVNQPEVSLGPGVKAMYENGMVRVKADSHADAGKYNGAMTVTISVK